MLNCHWQPNHDVGQYKSYCPVSGPTWQRGCAIMILTFISDCPMILSASPVKHIAHSMLPRSHHAVGLRKT